MWSVEEVCVVPHYTGPLNVWNGEGGGGHSITFTIHNRHCATQTLTHLDYIPLLHLFVYSESCPFFSTKGSK